MRLIIVSGLSGSGKSVALHMLEDLDFYCIDNIPAALLKPFISHTVRSPEPAYARIAVGLDARNRPGEIATVPTLVQELRRAGIACEVLFLHADDDALLNRYGETRRKHPLSSDGVSLREAIGAERRLLEPVTDAADLIIDTSGLTPHGLRDRIREAFADAPPESGLQVSIQSFGFKYGSPRDADLVFDVRFLPNPHWVEELRPLPGTEQPVRDYVQGQPQYEAFMERLEALLDVVVPGYVAEGKSYLTVAVGCTGGRHRSVVVAEELGAFLSGRGMPVSVTHRDLRRP